MGNKPTKKKQFKGINNTIVKWSPPPNKPITDQSGWTMLEAFGYGWMSNCVSLNRNKFLTAQSTYVSPTTLKRKGAVGIQSYNINENTWSIYLKYPRKYIIDYPQICMNGDGDKLCLWHEPYMTMVNLKQKKFSTCKASNYEDLLDVSIVYINNKYHFIGGGMFKIHAVWLTGRKTFKILHRFRKYKLAVTKHFVVHIKSQNRLLLISNQKTNARTGGELIWSYNIQTNEWIQIENIKFSVCNSYISSVMITNDEKHMFVFCENGIVIMDTLTMKIKKSNQSYPSQYKFGVGGVIMKQNYQMLISGFIRMMNFRHIPDDIIKIITLNLTAWTEEYVHLFAGSSKDKHWKIDVNSILNELND